MMMPITLNLEETGWLCHALMADPAFRKAVVDQQNNVPVEEPYDRMITLYGKVASANNYMMRNS